MKPILFNTEMVRAILDGRKTVTRRVIKPQPTSSSHIIVARMDNGTWFWWSGGEKKNEIKPPYRPGDILYVRETWAPFYETMHSVPVIGYRYYSETDEEIKERLPEYLNWFWPGRWFPSIHMPREAARIFLRVTDVRVERLQDMTHDSPLKEGIRWRECPDGFTWKDGSEIYCCYTTPMGAMRALWNSTIKPKGRALYGWKANPWIWVIAFEKIGKEEAQP